MTGKPFSITTAIAYVNGLPHLGHAYEAILTDVMARFQRLDGRDVFFLTGTDEHGEKVAKSAEKAGMNPKEFADINARAFLDMDGILNISNDAFIRTTEGRHYKASQALWKKLQDRGEIYLDKYEGWYSVREEAYFTEDELTDAGQGKKLSPNGTEVEWVEEESYFFKLSAYTDKLLKYYEEHPEFIQPATRRNEIISFVKQGLRDLSISRHRKRLTWGVPVPGDDNHVMYVWLDALTNYITALGYPDENADLYRKYWPAHFHVIGKDIIRFHAVYWPAFLISANVPLPQAVFAHGFINVQGQKMSKSVGNVLSPDALVKTYGLDPFRYFLMREIPHGDDGSFSHEQAILRINADLANGIGNLAQRTLSMIYKNCDAKIPEPEKFAKDDEILIDEVRVKMLGAVRSEFSKFRFNRGLESIMAAVAKADAYVDAQAPWKLKKEDPGRMNTVLYTLAECVRCIAIALQPVVPDGSAKLLDQLLIPKDQRKLENIAADFTLKPGTQIDQPQGAFPRLVDEAEDKLATG